MMIKRKTDHEGLDFFFTFDSEDAVEAAVTGNMWTSVEKILNASTQNHIRVIEVARLCMIVVAASMATMVTGIGEVWVMAQIGICMAMANSMEDLQVLVNRAMTRTGDTKAPTHRVMTRRAMSSVKSTSSRVH